MKLQAQDMDERRQEKARARAEHLSRIESGLSGDANGVTDPGEEATPPDPFDVARNVAAAREGQGIGGGRLRVSLKRSVADTPDSKFEQLHMVSHIWACLRKLLMTW